MRKELEDILYEASPVFYRERILPAEETLMCYGFECGDGWFEPLLVFSREARRIKNKFRLFPKTGILVTIWLRKCPI